MWQNDTTGYWLSAVWYWGEIFTKKSINSTKSKIENILTHWSVAQAGSNDEKTEGRKSCWTVSLRSVLLYKWKKFTSESDTPYILSLVGSYCIIKKNLEWLFKISNLYSVINRSLSRSWTISQVFTHTLWYTVQDLCSSCS